jgi:hypothetical protein
MLFQSPDTIVPNPGNPKDLNRYAYARANPVKYLDPSGHAAVCWDDCSTLAGETPESWRNLRYSDRKVAVEAAAQYHENPDYYNDIYRSGRSDPVLTGLNVYAQYRYNTFLDQLMSTDSFQAYIARADQAHQDIADGKIDKWEFLRRLTPAVIAMGITQAAEGAVGTTKLFDGMRLPTNSALDAAVEFLGPGYKDMGNGRFLSADGFRQVRMSDGDIMGWHGGGPHINFETRTPVSGRPGQFRWTDMHIHIGEP